MSTDRPAASELPSTRGRAAPRDVSRRTLLATGAAALAVGAGGTEIGNLAAGGSGSGAGSGSGVGSGSVPPDVDLMEEHGVLKRVLLIYEEALRRIAGGQPAPAQEIHDAAEIIHDFVEGFHEALEEAYIFPRLQAARQLVSTVDTLLVQHGRGRQATQTILGGATAAGMNDPATVQQVTAAMTAFIRMYEPHEAREDTVVFPAFRALLSAKELEHLAGTFADQQRKQLGPNAFNATIARVAEIEEALGIYDLNQFTPAPPAP